MGLITLKGDLVTANAIFNNCSSITNTLIATTKTLEPENADRIRLPCERVKNFITYNKPFIITTKGEIDRGLETFMHSYSLQLKSWVNMCYKIQMQVSDLIKQGEIIKFYYLLNESWDFLFFGGDIIFTDLTDISNLRKYNSNLSKFSSYSSFLAREALKWNSRLIIGKR